VLIFAAVSNLLLKLCDTRPVVLVLDDLHWMDAPSLELLAHVTFPITEAVIRRPVSVLVISTYRPDGLDQRAAHAVDRLQREEVCELLTLDGLAEFAVDQLMREVGFERPSHQLVVTVASATRGNPLFIQEALAHLRSSDTIVERGGYLVTTVSPSDLKLPRQIIDVISSRLATLAEDDRRILTIAAFLGDDFAYETLAAVCDTAEDALLDILDRAIRGRFLINEDAGFRFAHPLIRHVLYAEASLPRRHRLHKQLADRLELLYADSLEQHVSEIAHHLMNSGTQADPDKVIEACKVAGERAMSVYAWGEAARYFEAALAAIARSETDSILDRARLQYWAGFAYYRDLDIGPSLDHLAAAIESFREAGDQRGLTQTLIQYANCRITQASVAFGTLADVEMLEEELAHLAEEHADLRAEALAQLSQVYWTARQSKKAEETALESLAMAQALDDDVLVVGACSSLGLAYIQTLRIRDALASYHQGLQAARRTGDYWLEGWPLARIPLAHLWLGELDQAQATAQEGIEVMRRSHDWAELSMTIATLISVETIRGNFEAAERHAHQAMVATNRSRYPWGAALFLPALACGRALRGEWEEAEDALELLTTPGRIFEEPGSAIEGISLLYRGLMAAHRGETTESERIAALQARLLQQARPDVASVAAYASAVEIADRMKTATDVAGAERALMTAAQHEMVITSGWLFLMPRALGLASSVAGHLDEAVSRLDIAMQVAAGLGARPERGRACIDLARVLMRRSGKADRERAAELVAEAGRVFQELGMHPFVDQAAAVALEVQTSLPRVEKPPSRFPDRLSIREVEVLQLVARGRSNQQIADELILSAKTIARHVSNIFDKIGVQNRSAATAYAFEKGLAAGN
jgi:DNA-binding CsgD family transcriptional regulator/tetratricopeptide (TPR) repeat protein